MRDKEIILNAFDPLANDDHPIPSSQFRILIEVLIDIRDTLYEIYEYGIQPRER